MEQLKITFISGLQEVVLGEISKCTPLKGKIFLSERNDDSLFFNFDMSIESDIDENISDIGEEISTIDTEIYAGLLSLKSVMNVFLVQRGEKLHPLHINNHKSILGDMVETVLRLEKEKMASKEKSAFKTFKLRCAGSDSPEVQSIQRYISETFKLQAIQIAGTNSGIASAEAGNLSLGVDLDMYIHRPDALWEVGVRLTPRPLSVRDYKIEHIKGGINPTVAYAMNTMAFSHILTRTPSLSSPHPLDHNTHANLSYLNICSGSATLLIEARLQFATADASMSGHFLGFDIDKKTNSQAIHNIQNAGLIRDIQIKTADLLDKPNFGNERALFDVITSDLPFGMQVGKGDDLDKLYKTLVEYATEKLKEDGVLVVYTTEVETLGKALRGSAFTIEKAVSLKLTTSVGSIIQPKIFVCSKKAD
ncbi:MAG: tRNA (guanine6-N2)-methyltransferase [Patescibacteria group bacterium]|nr:tRNA (guanine6-N2)-methyltransferase [Patescibacteria group bacterium]